MTNPNGKERQTTTCTFCPETEGLMWHNSEQFCIKHLPTYWDRRSNTGFLPEYNNNAPRRWSAFRLRYRKANN